MTSQEMAKEWSRRARGAEGEFRKTMRGLGISAVALSKALMTAEIYAIPEDRTKRGKKKWQRTGRLRASEQFIQPDPYTVEVTNAMGYAEPRHEAGKPGHRKINPLRLSHWRDEMVEKLAPVMEELLDLTITKIWERP